MRSTGASPAAVTATLSLKRPLRVRIVTKQAGLKDLAGSPDIDIDIDIDGSLLDLAKFFSLLDKPDLIFPIVMPKE
jgi:alkyl sulfatase BDS1-like metallo-beta-lactamase superfamily hydrolase